MVTRRRKRQKPRRRRDLRVSSRRHCARAGTRAPASRPRTKCRLPPATDAAPRAALLALALIITVHARGQPQPLYVRKAHVSVHRAQLCCRALHVEWG